MLSSKFQTIKILFVLLLLSIPGGVFSQVTGPDTAYYDTTDYVSDLYRGSLDYNLMIAASKGYTREIGRLILNGADVSAETYEGATPLIFAVSGNQTEVAELLIGYGSDVNKATARQVTPLLIAVKNQNQELAETLIRAGADIDFSDKYDATALHYSAVYGYLPIVDMLLYYEASIDKKTIEGSTPLLASVWAGNADVADLLIQNGADIEASDNEGYTPFLMAALNGDTLIMRLLIKRGVDIYATNKLNQNALALAIMTDQRDAVAFLLKIGDNWVDRGKNSVSPYTVASKYQRKDIIRILEENKVPGNLKYEIDQVDIMASTRFSLHDIYTGASLSFKEPYLNGGIIVGCDVKIWYTRVLQQQSEHLFYQYMDRGSVVYAGLFKDFALSNYAFKGNFELSTSLSAAYSFGNQLKGTLYAAPDKFMVVPALKIKWTKKDLSFSLGADYMKTDFYHIGPVWIRLGASYNLYFDKVRTKGKTLKWY
jgi:ankyrin repeat protein